MVSERLLSQTLFLGPTTTKATLWCMSQRWHDMSDDSPPRDAPAPGGLGNINSPDALQARQNVLAVEAKIRLLPSILDDNYIEDELADLQAQLREAKAHYLQVLAAARANAEAAEAAAALAAAEAQRTPPVPIMPDIDESRPTLVMLRGELQALEGRVMGAVKDVRDSVSSMRPLSYASTVATGGLAVGADVGAPSGKHNVPSPPKFSGVRGDGKLPDDIWLMQLSDWCEYIQIALPKRVGCAVQCLEGQAVQNWYNLRRQLESDGADVSDWQIFRNAMIKQYADVSPDISVRNSLIALKQGTGTVQSLL